MASLKKKSKRTSSLGILKPPPRLFLVAALRSYWGISSDGWKRRKTKGVATCALVPLFGLLWGWAGLIHLLVITQHMCQCEPLDAASWGNKATVILCFYFVRKCTKARLANVQNLFEANWGNKPQWVTKNLRACVLADLPSEGKLSQDLHPLSKMLFSCLKNACDVWPEGKYPKFSLHLALGKISMLTLIS